MNITPTERVCLPDFAKFSFVVAENMVGAGRIQVGGTNIVTDFDRTSYANLATWTIKDVQSDVRPSVDQGAR